MASERMLLRPYPSGVTGEKVGEWLLRGLPGTYLPPDGLPGEEPSPEVHLCPRCGCPDDPGEDGCHRLLCN